LQRVIPVELSLHNFDWKGRLCWDEICGKHCNVAWGDGDMSDTFQTASPVKSTSVRDYITAPENSESFHEEHKVGDQ